MTGNSLFPIKILAEKNQYLYLYRELFTLTFVSYKNSMNKKIKYSGITCNLFYNFANANLCKYANNICFLCKNNLGRFRLTGKSMCF